MNPARPLDYLAVLPSPPHNSVDWAAVACVVDLAAEGWGGGALVEDRDRRVAAVGDGLFRLFGRSVPPGAIAGTPSGELLAALSPRTRQPARFLRRTEAIVRAARPVSGDPVLLRGGRALERDYAPLRDRHGHLLGHLWYYRDATARHWERALLACQRRTLRAIAADRPLPEILTQLAIALETHLDEGAASILLASADGTVLRRGIAPNLPEPLARLGDGLPAIEGAGSCGTAAHRRERVAVAAIATDPLWAPFRGIPLALGFRAAWSLPILATDGQLLGVLAYYARRPGLPQPWQWRLMGAVGRLTCLALENRAASRRGCEAHDRVLVDCSTDFIARHDRQGRYRYASPACRTLLGREPAELLGRPAETFCHPEDRDRLRAAREAAIAGAEGRVEYRLHRADGSDRWVETVGRAIVGPDGDWEWLAATRDIGDRKQVELQLRASREFLQQVIDNIPQVVAWKDRDSRYLGGNRRLLEVTGLASADELAGKTDYDLPWTPEQADWYRTCDRRVMETGQPEYRILEFQQQAGGREAWLDTNKMPLRDETGRVVGVLVTFEDITEREAAKRALQQQSEALAAFSASLKHLHRLSSRHYRDFDELFAAYLQTGCEILDLDTGLIGRVTDDRYRVEFARTPLPVAPGDTLELRETYCWDTLRSGQTVALAGLDDRPDLRCRWIYRQFQFETYIGTPIWSDGEIYGILCFATVARRDRPFEEREVEWIELMARDLGRFVAAHRSERQRQAAEAALRESEAKYRSIFENITQGIFQTTPEGRYLNANPFLARLYGYDSPQEMIETVTDLARQVYVDPQRRQTLIRLTAERGTVYNFESQVYRKDGSIIWVAETQKAVYDKAGRLRFYEGTVEDITARRQAEAQLQYDAHHDKLTGLYNRLWFFQRLRRTMDACRRGAIAGYAVLFVDLDRFKVVNDSLGHLVGDRLLVQVARRLEAAAGPADALARFGGDEFAILLGNAARPEAAVEAARRFVKRLNLPILLDEREFSVGASIGIALGGADYDEPEELLRDADLAMYAAKAAGGNRYACFETAMRPRALTRLQLEHDLHRALDAREFQLHYQPIATLADGTLTGFEALLRWRHPERGWISPEAFVPLAEETGAIDRLGWWVLESACQHLKIWRRDHPEAADLTVRVNVSLLQLRHRDFARRLAALLRSLDLPPAFLKLEITETSFLETANFDDGILRELQAAGVGLCIDDFGTGYSSLSRLHKLPFDTIKIDRAFVSGLGLGETREAIAETIVTLANRLEVTVVPEGIETADQLSRLRALGCQVGQGYWFSPPVPADRVAALLTRGVRGCFGDRAGDSPG